MTVGTAGPELAPPKTDQPSTDLWAKASAYIQKELSEQCYKNWVGPARFLKYEANVLTLELPDKFFADWLRDHYHAIIQEAVFQAAGVRPEIQYAIVDRSFKPSLQPLSGGVRKPVPGEPLGLNDRYTFQNFVVGPGNRFAHAAALAVCEAPAKNYNPLFIYGRVGLGKTHLMQAAAHAYLERNPNLKSVYITGEKFTNQLISAIQNRTTHQFRMRYRTADILMVDDIHFIAGKESTQEEFFHTFNTLYDAHKQIIVTSDRPPKEIPNLEDRLTSRFAWGLVADIQPPDFETRVAILKKKIEKETVTVPDEVIFFIAEKIKSNIRELEGALMRVVAYTSLTGVAADRRVVEVEVLKDSLREELGKVSIDQIQKCVSEYFQIKVSELRAKSRSKSVVHPRHVAMYLVRSMTDHSLPEIGGFFGGRGHATVIHACNKVENELRVGGKTQVIIDRIKMLILKV